MYNHLKNAQAKIVISLVFYLLLIGCKSKEITLTKPLLTDLNQEKKQAIAPRSTLRDRTESKAFAQNPTGEKLIDIQKVNPKIRLDIRYATNNNFVGEKLYSSPRCLLRYSVAQRLSKVQQNLEKIGLGLKVYDCYRPLSVTRIMWEKAPDSNYVANPAKGSRHNRGSSVDLTLVNRNGKELEMPTNFDDFTEKAHGNYQGGSYQSRSNRQLLKKVMIAQRFIPLSTEWWHFDAEDWQKFSLLDIPFEKIPK